MDTIYTVKIIEGNVLNELIDEWRRFSASFSS